ncbi:glycosyltransferase [Pseudogemmobacter sp. W21_MBD1_M6]|uniref:glycosyltransferase n=1 Tax=Pseudogemmobacter sp. W21_MBD1_M6 TaxID=3240271 RepID=UPI003F9B353F
MTLPRIAHLVDDTSAGGVTRVLDFIRSNPDMARFAQHVVHVLPRGKMSAPSMDADVLVSHLSINWRGLAGLMSLRAANAAVPMIHVEHSYTAGFTGSNVLRRARFRTLLRTAYALFDRVVAVSEDQGKWLVARGVVQHNALSVIPSAVDVAPFLALSPRFDRPKVIGAIGRFDTQKGFDTLIKAFRQSAHPDQELHLIGDGPERENLETLAAGHPRITFTGFATDPVAAMEKVDAIAMPSRWEAYGLVALEARAAGRPLVVSAIDGLNDHIARGAIAVSSHSVDEWACALNRLNETPDSFAMACARKDAASAGKAFSQAWNALLASVLNKEPAAIAA